MQSNFNVLKGMFAVGLAALIAWPHGLYAQDDPPMYCAELAAEDCAILTMARESMQGVHSLTGDASFELIISNIPDAPFDEITLDIEQQSAFNFSDNGMAVRAKLSDVELVSGMLQEDPVAFLGLYSELIVGSNFESSFHIAVSDETMALIQEAIEEDSGDPIPFALPNEFGVSSRIIDGTMFTNLSEMLDPLPGFKALGDVWFGFEYGPMMDFTMAAARADGDLDPMDEDEAAIAAQFIAALAGANGGPIVATVAGLPFSEDILPSFAVERVEDGAGTARIRTTIDYATLLAEPIVQELLADLIRDPDFGDTDMSDEEMTELMAVVQLMGPTVLDSLGLEIIEEIDPETGYLVGSEFHLNWDIDALAPLINMAGGPDLSGLEDAPVIAMNGTAAYSDHNSDVVIETPESALIFSFEEILELIPEEELQMLLNDSEPEYDVAVAAPDASAAIDSIVATADTAEKAALMLEEARNAVDEEEYAYAIILLDAALEIDPEFSAAYAERANAYHNMAEYELSLADYGVAILYDSANPDLYVDRGLVHYSLEQINDEIADYTLAIGLKPDYALAYYYRALSYEDLGMADLALADYGEVVALEPDNSNVHYDRGTLHQEIGNNAEAIADFERYLELEPDSTDREEVEGFISDLQ